MLDLKQLEALLAPRFAQGESQNAVARSLGLESSALSRWRNGGNALYAQVAMVAERLNVPVARLWRGAVPRKYATGVAHGTTEAPPVAAALDAAYARGLAVAEFRAIAEAAHDIERRARRAAEQMQRPVTVSSAGVPAEAEERPSVPVRGAAEAKASRTSAGRKGR